MFSSESVAVLTCSSLSPCRGKFSSQPLTAVFSKQIWPFVFILICTCFCRVGHLLCAYGPEFHCLTSSALAAPSLSALPAGVVSYRSHFKIKLVSFPNQPPCLSLQLGPESRIPGETSMRLHIFLPSFSVPSFSVPPKGREERALDDPRSLLNPLQ